MTSSPGLRAWNKAPVLKPNTPKQVRLLRKGKASRPAQHCHPGHNWPRSHPTLGHTRAAAFLGTFHAHKPGRPCPVFWAPIHAGMSQSLALPSLPPKKKITEVHTNQCIDQQNF